MLSSCGRPPAWTAADALSLIHISDPNGIEDTYFYEVPQIDDDTEDAKHINEMINYRYGYLVERCLLYTSPVLVLNIAFKQAPYQLLVLNDHNAYH